MVVKMVVPVEAKSVVAGSIITVCMVTEVEVEVVPVKVERVVAVGITTICGGTEMERWWCQLKPRGSWQWLPLLFM